MEHLRDKICAVRKIVSAVDLQITAGDQFGDPDTFPFAGDEAHRNAVEPVLRKDLAFFLRAHIFVAFAEHGVLEPRNPLRRGFPFPACGHGRRRSLYGLLVDVAAEYLHLADLMRERNPP